MQNYDEVTTGKQCGDHRISVRYTLNGKKHRIDGPAEIWHYPNGAVSESYCLNGKLHREDGPAEIWYYPDDSVERREYYLHGKLHREDGPAVVRMEHGTICESFYYLHGVAIEDF